jgi:D-alanine-D-alanine ligase
MLKKKNIALVTGGFSKESEIAFKSAVEVEKNIDNSRYNVFKIIISSNKWYYLDAQKNEIEINKNNFSIETSDGKITFDCVFILIHGTPGEDGKLQGYFDLLGIPYTTCDHTTSAFTFNKAYCNRIVKSLGINVSKSIHLIKNQDFSIERIIEEINFPCFVKPNNGGSSIGMSKVNKPDELSKAIKKAFKEDSQVLIEEYIKGKELTCGMINTGKGLLVFPITQIIPIDKEYFDYEAKYKGKSKEITPAEIDENISIKIKSTSSYLYNKLNCKGIVRFDYILEDNTNKLFFLEVNTVPGQTTESIVPQQIRAMGLTTKEIYTELIETSIKNCK